MRCTPIEQKRVAIRSSQSDATDAVTRTVACVDAAEAKPVGARERGTLLAIQISEECLTFENILSGSGSGRVGECISSTTEIFKVITK
jgi:hypothetical protein